MKQKTQTQNIKKENNSTAVTTLENLRFGTGLFLSSNKLNVNMIEFDTDYLAEGVSNLYYTSERVEQDIAAYLKTQDISSQVRNGYGISINANEISINDHEIKTLFSANTGIEYNPMSGQFGLSILNGYGISVTNNEVAINKDEIKLLFSSGEGIEYDPTSGQFRLAPLPKITEIIAGDGLTGGGTSGTLTINIGQGDGIIANENNVSLAPTVAGQGLIFEAGSLSIGAGAGITVFSDHISVDMSAFDTGSLAEGANSWFTRDRAISAIDSYLTPGIGINVLEGRISLDTYYDLSVAASCEKVDQYYSDTLYDPCTVLIFGGDNEVTTTETPYHHAIAGVVVGEFENLNETIKLVKVQSRGACIVRVIGVVKKGDLLVNSCVPGYAMCADLTKTIVPTACVGIAISENNQDYGKVTVQLK